MMEIVKKIAKLIDVKTIVTFSVVGGVIFLAVTGVLEPNKLFELSMIIVTFFFSRKANE
ncbi:MAG: hypothetical protein PHD60_11490 [Clostridia bacterium]|nr:hypothetical protein [Clostridia bacterium]